MALKGFYYAGLRYGEGNRVNIDNPKTPHDHLGGAETRAELLPTARNHLTNHLGLTLTFHNGNHMIEVPQIKAAYLQTAKELVCDALSDACAIILLPPVITTKPVAQMGRDGKPSVTKHGDPINLFGLSVTQITFRVPTAPHKHLRREVQKLHHMLQLLNP